MITVPTGYTHLVFSAVRVVGVAAVVLHLVVQCLPGGMQVLPQIVSFNLK